MAVPVMQEAAVAVGRSAATPIANRVLFRLCTENVNRPAVEALVNQHFAGSTVLAGTGYWKGTAEPCLVIEIVHDHAVRERVRTLCREIKVLNEQTEVLLQVVPITEERL